MFIPAFALSLNRVRSLLFQYQQKTVGCVCLGLRRTEKPEERSERKTHGDMKGGGAVITPPRAVTSVCRGNRPSVSVTKTQREQTSYNQIFITNGVLTVNKNNLF